MVHWNARPGTNQFRKKKGVNMEDVVIVRILMNTRKISKHMIGMILKDQKEGKI